MPDEFAAEANPVGHNGAPAISADTLRHTFATEPRVCARAHAPRVPASFMRAFGSPGAVTSHRHSRLDRPRSAVETDRQTLLPVTRRISRGQDLLD
ncbi:hypothetical protein Misp02_26900 [Microtetraspora sp. NBRC 16547]|nr:hypothetical protein Misp02_26900 [Microtetraspora sp. NBRC 16547]